MDESIVCIGDINSGLRPKYLPATRDAERQCVINATLLQYAVPSTCQAAQVLPP